MVTRIFTCRIEYLQETAAKQQKQWTDSSSPHLVFESPRQSRPAEPQPMDVDMMNTLISAAGPATLPASVVSQIKPQAKVSLQLLWYILDVEGIGGKKF